MNIFKKYKMRKASVRISDKGEMLQYRKGICYRIHHIDKIDGTAISFVAMKIYDNYFEGEKPFPLLRHSTSGERRLFSSIGLAIDDDGFIC